VNVKENGPRGKAGFCQATLGKMDKVGPTLGKSLDLLDSWLQGGWTFLVVREVRDQVRPARRQK